MIELADLQLRLRRHAADALFDDLLVGETAHYFEDEFGQDHVGQYRAFRAMVGEIFEVDANDVALVGSARIGFSLNPKHLFRSFDALKSDFDVVIVAPDAFEELWGCYFDAHYRREGRSFQAQYGNLFRRFLTTHNLAASDPAFTRWEKRRLGPLRRRVETDFYFGSSVNFRIYRDWDAVRSYHVDSFKAAKSELQT